MNSEETASQSYCSQLKEAISGLSYRSESDYPLELICCAQEAASELDAELLLSMLGLESGALVEEGDAQEFLDSCARIEDWFDEEEKQMARGFANLAHLLKQKVENLRLFRTGQIEVTIALLGKYEESWLGFRTISVET